MELALYIRLTSNSQRSSWLCFVRSRNKGMFHYACLMKNLKYSIKYPYGWHRHYDLRVQWRKPRAIIEVQPGKLCCRVQIHLLIYCCPWLFSEKVTQGDKKIGTIVLLDFKTYMHSFQGKHKNFLFIPEVWDIYN